LKQLVHDSYPELIWGGAELSDTGLTAAGRHEAEAEEVGNRLQQLWTHVVLEIVKRQEGAVGERKMADLMIGDKHRQKNVALRAQMFAAVALVVGHATIDLDVREDAFEIVEDAAEQSNVDRAALDRSGLRLGVCLEGLDERIFQSTVVVVECERHFAEIPALEEVRGEFDPADPSRDARGGFEQLLEAQPALSLKDAASDGVERFCKSVEGDVVEGLAGESQGG
jgi:hypothetical protein